MSQHGYMRHTATPPLVLEIGQKLWHERPIYTTIVIWPVAIPDEKYQNSPTGGKRSPTGGG